MKRKKKIVAAWMTMVMAAIAVASTEPPGLIAQAEYSCDMKTGDEVGKIGTDEAVCQENIDRYVRAVSQLPVYLSETNAQQISDKLQQAYNLYESLTPMEKEEPEVISAYGAWSDMVMQSQNTALAGGNISIHYVSPNALGEIENLVPRQGEAGPESEASLLDEHNSTATNGSITANVIHDQRTGGNQEMFSLSAEGSRLDESAKLTVRYVNIGTYYEGRIYTDQDVQGIKVNAIVTISNPYNANRISLYENFWMGGTVNGGSGKLGYGTGTPGSAEVSITFCDENWNVIRLKEDAQLIASSISHGYYKGCSYEGISFSETGTDTTVRIYRQSHGNIGIDEGEVFGLGQTFYGERTCREYCADVGGPHDGGQPYADTRQSATFMVHGVGFYQNADTWKMIMTTQTTYSGGHDYWFYFTAAPANMARPKAPVKTVSKREAEAGEELEYTLEQQLSTVQEDGYGYYGSLIFYDTLPAEMEYLSAKMYLDDEDVTATAGVLDYNLAIGKVTYSFSEAYLQSMEYGGQVAKLIISCRLKEKNTSTDPIVNEGYVLICGRVESATAVITPLIKPVEADRQICMIKQIKGSDIVLDHGDPCFIFRLEGTDVLGKKRICYRWVVFDEMYVQNHLDENGFVCGEVVFDGLFPGVYTVSEEVTNRYEVETVVPGENVTIQGETAIFDLTEAQWANATIINRKYEQGGFSHSCLAENVLQ